MLIKYLISLLLLANVPLTIGLLRAPSVYDPPREPAQGHTCNCNCNFARTTTYYDAYGNQQTMVCISVPITVQGMYPQNPGRPGYQPTGYPSNAPSYPSYDGRPPYPGGYNSAPGGWGPAPGQYAPPDAADTKKPALSTAPHPDGPGGSGSEAGSDAADQFRVEDLKPTLNFTNRTPIYVK